MVMTVLQVLLAFISIVVHFVVAHRLKCTKKTLDCLREDFVPFLEKEVISVYQTQKERQEQPEKFAQTFTPYEKEYVLNPEDNNLEELKGPGKNVQAQIDSYLECALDRILARFEESAALYKKSVADDLVNDYTVAKDDLMSLAEGMDVAEEYREKYHLPDTYSMADIYGYVDKLAAGMKEKLENLGKKEDKKEDEKSS